MTATIGNGACDPRRAAWAYLSRVALGPSAPLNALIEAVGVEEAAHAVRDRELPEPLRPLSRRRAQDTSARDLELMADLGGRLLTPDDPDWPSWRMLAFAGPAAVRDPVGAAPVALWVLGCLSVTEVSEQALAVVGSRAASGYGEQITADLAGELAQRGWSIVSGAAHGIDAAAHRAALAAGATTIAVLASGVDRPSPAGHARLLRRIAETGLVISEYPPGTTPAKHHFLVRNRLIAGLADAVLVVEAGNRSGARNTAGWARRLGRPVLAVPGSVRSASSVGCHRMIREGQARLVTCVADVLEEAGPLDPRPTPEASGLSGEQQAVYEALPALGSRTPRQLAEEAGVTQTIVRAVLPVLELSGYVGCDETGWYRRVARKRPGKDLC